MEGTVRVDHKGQRKEKGESFARTLGSPLFLWFGPLAHVRAIARRFGPPLEHPHQCVREVYAGAKERERLGAVLVNP